MMFEATLMFVLIIALVLQIAILLVLVAYDKGLLTDFTKGSPTGLLSPENMSLVEQWIPYTIGANVLFIILVAIIVFKK